MVSMQKKINFENLKFYKKINNFKCCKLFFCSMQTFKFVFQQTPKALYFFVKTYLGMVLSSMKEYLEVISPKVQANNLLSFFGYALSAYSVAELTFSPVYGKITDKIPLNKVKVVLIISCLTSTLGLYYKIKKNTFKI